MRRREFISLLGGAASWPLAARAQQGERIRRIGVLMPAAESDPEWQAYVAAFRDGLRKLGWVEGHNIRIDYRWAAGDADRMRAYAAELVTMTADVMLTGGLSALAVQQQTTRTIPIVFAGASDPVAAGLLTSLARPGGNITGFVVFEHAIGVKWLELLKQIAPRVTRAAFIYDPANPTSSDYLRAIEGGGAFVRRRGIGGARPRSRGLPRNRGGSAEAATGEQKRHGRPLCRQRRALAWRKV